MTSNVFNDGEPIVAVQVSNETAEVDTPSNNTKPKRTTRKKAASKSKSIPKVGVTLHNGAEMPWTSGTTIELRVTLKEGDEVEVRTGDHREVTRPVKVLPGELKGNTGFVLASGERAKVPLNFQLGIPEGYSLQFDSDPTLELGLTAAHPALVEDGYLCLINNSHSRVFVEDGELYATVKIVENLQFELTELN